MLSLSVRALPVSVPWHLAVLGGIQACRAITFD